MPWRTHVKRTVTVCVTLVAAGAAGAAPAGAALVLTRPGGEAVVQANTTATVTEHCPARTRHPIGAQFGALTAATNKALARGSDERHGTLYLRIERSVMTSNCAGQPGDRSRT
jgi:hypothetical protein